MLERYWFSHENNENLSGDFDSIRWGFCVESYNCQHDLIKLSNQFQILIPIVNFTVLSFSYQFLKTAKMSAKWWLLLNVLSFEYWIKLFINRAIMLANFSYVFFSLSLSLWNNQSKYLYFPSGYSEFQFTINESFYWLSRCAFWNIFRWRSCLKTCGVVWIQLIWLLSSLFRHSLFLTSYWTFSQRVSFILVYHIREMLVCCVWFILMSLCIRGKKLFPRWSRYWFWLAGLRETVFSTMFKRTTGLYFGTEIAKKVCGHMS